MKNEILREQFLKRKHELNKEFEWSQENREKIVEISDYFMREFQAAYDEAKKQSKILRERISDGDLFVNDCAFEIKLSFYYADIFEKCDDEKDDYDSDIDDFVSENCEIKYHSYRDYRYGRENPIYIDREDNWNIEIFPKDWDENMYVSYAVHQLVCDGILSFQDLLRIKHIFSEVVVRIQKN